MKMKAKIGSTKYPIEFVEEILDPDGRKMDGEGCESGGYIKVGKGSCLERQREVVLHEVIHLIADHTGNGDLKEEIIEALSYGIFDFIRENPDIVKYIQGELEDRMIGENGNPF